MTFIHQPTSRNVTVLHSRLSIIWKTLDSYLQLNHRLSPRLNRRQTPFRVRTKINNPKTRTGRTTTRRGISRGRVRKGKETGRVTTVSPRNKPYISSATRVASSMLGSVEWALMSVITVARRAIWWRTAPEWAICSSNREPVLQWAGHHRGTYYTIGETWGTSTSNKC